MKTITSIPKFEIWAMDKLREYAAEDSITAEDLALLFRAYDSGNVELFKAEGRKVLFHYAACSTAIDELCEWCKR